LFPRVSQGDQSPIFNFAPRDKLWPQVWIVSPGVEILCSPLHSSKQESVNPWGWTKVWTFSLGDKVNPGGQSWS
jgi:hypothetical protein